MKKHNYKKCQCCACKSHRGEYKGKTHPNYKEKVIKYCIDCKKELNKKSHLFNTKRCHSCDTKYRHKQGNQIGKKNNLYIDGRYSKKFYCIDCKKGIWYERKRCKSCNSKYLNKIGKIGLKKGHNIGIKGKGSKVNLICKHHIDLNKSNNKKSNKLILNCSIHSRLHQSAYGYLVKIGLVKKYIKWFLKYKIDNKDKLFLQEIKNG